MTGICVVEEEVVGGTAANHLLLPFNFLNTCHSERSEESHSLSRTVMILYKYIVWQISDWFLHTIKQLNQNNKARKDFTLNGPYQVCKIQVLIH